MSAQAASSPRAEGVDEQRVTPVSFPPHTTQAGPAVPPTLSLSTTDQSSDQPPQQRHPTRQVPLARSHRPSRTRLAQRLGAMSERTTRSKTKAKELAASAGAGQEGGAGVGEGGGQLGESVSSVGEMSGLWSSPPPTGSTKSARTTASRNLEGEA